MRLRRKDINEAAGLAEIINRENVQVVYDIGAHRGEWSIEYSKIFKRAAFYCFSPFQYPHEIRVPGHKWIYGVLSKPGVSSVQFYSKKTGGDSYYKEVTGVHDKVKPNVMPARTIDSYNLPPPQVIKIDTQGSELDILSGAEEAMKSCLMVMTEVPLVTYNVGAPTYDEYLDYFLKRDFVPVVLETIHFSGARVVQVDLVFIKNNLARKYNNDIVIMGRNRRPK